MSSEQQGEGASHTPSTGEGGWPGQPAPAPFTVPPPGQGPPPGFTVPPPSQPGAFSPDGRWFWNGQQWVPAAPPPPPGGRNKTTAGLLGILLGDFGAHKFYLGETGLGILYLVFFWTLIPGIAGLVEGIVYLTMSDQDFAAKYNSGQFAPLVQPPGPPPPSWQSSPPHRP